MNRRSWFNWKPIYHKYYIGELQFHSGHWPTCGGTWSILESLFISHLWKPSSVLCKYYTQETKWRIWHYCRCFKRLVLDTAKFKITVKKVCSDRFVCCYFSKKVRVVEYFRHVELGSRVNLFSTLWKNCIYTSVYDRWVDK